MRVNIIITGLLLTLMGLVVYVSLDMNNESEKEIISIFQVHQQDIASQIANRIEFSLNEFGNDVHQLSVFLTQQNPTNGEIEEYLKETFYHLQRKHISAISIIDQKGRIEYSTDRNAIGLNYGDSESFKLAKVINKNDSIIVSDLKNFRDERTGKNITQIIISAPVVKLFNNSDEGKVAEQFEGVAQYSLNIDKFISAQLLFLDTEHSEHQAWVMDKKGITLFNSEHPEMVMRNINQHDETCKQCHYSFDDFRQVSNLNRGTFDYKIKNYPKKLAAFSKANFGNTAWTISITTPYNSIVEVMDNNFTKTIVLIGIVFMLLIWSFIFVYVSNRSKIRAEEEAKQLQEKEALKKQIGLTEERYRTIVETSHDIIWTLDTKGNFTFVNKRGEEITGMKISSLLGKHFAPLILADDLPRIQEIFNKTLEGESQQYEVKVYTKKTGVIVLSVNTVPLYDNNAITGTVSFGRDITEQKRTEESLLKLNRFYSFISQSNQMILRVKNNEILFNEACKIAVEYGNFDVVWIGIVDKENKVIKPVAWEGLEEDDLSECKLEFEDNSKTEKITSRVIRTGKYVVCNDIANGMYVDNLCKETLKQKCNSVIALPIKLQDETIGVFHIYSTEINFFDEAEIRLLEEVGSDISYAVETVKKEEMRKQAEKALLEAEERFRTVFENTIVGLYRTTPDGRILLANPALVNMLGYKSFDELAKRNLEIEGYATQNERAIFKEKIEKNGEVIGLETTWEKADGTTICLLENARAIVDEKGNAIYYEGAVEDISEHKQAELLQTAVFQISQAADTATMLDEFYEAVHKCIATVMPARNFFIATYDEKTNLLHFPYFVDEVDAEIDLTPQKPGKELSAYVLRTGKSLLCDEAMDKKLRDAGEIEIIGTQSPIWAGVPLKIANNTIGVMVVQHYTDPNAYGERELKVLEYVSSQIARTIERKIKQEEIKASEEKFRALAEDSPNMIFINKDGRIVYANKKCEEKMGYSKEEFYNHNFNFLKIIAPESIDKVKEKYAERFNGNEQLTYEYTLMTKKNERIEAILAGKVIEYEGGKALLGTITDITARKALEKAAIEAKENAEEMNRLKSNFLANMSHELRTPMIGILGFAEIMKSETDIYEMKKMADTIYNSSNRLMETLNQILDLSLIETGRHKINLNSVKIADIVLESVKLYKPFAKRNSLTLDALIKDKTATAKLEERILLKIINNLVNNAIKFTNEGGVTVEVDKDRNNGKHYVVINVKDTGIGISKENHNIIFEEFRQVSEGLSRKYEGSGLGLTITRKFVELLGGEIMLESEPGKGSIFTIRFPSVEHNGILDKPISDSDSIYSNNTIDSTDKKILLVEDDQITFDLVKFTLKNTYALQYAVDGETAIELAGKIKYDIILMDINLGHGMNGVEIVKQIRNMPGYEKTPIVALTAYAMTGDKERFLSSGFTHYLSKPFKRESFIGLIKSILMNEMVNVTTT